MRGFGLSVSIKDDRGIALISVMILVAVMSAAAVASFEYLSFGYQSDLRMKMQKEKMV